MDNSLQTALKNLIENQATQDEISLIREAYANGNISIDGNIQNSVILIGNRECRITGLKLRDEMSKM